jgi:8-oxo-dGTP pyrophosphatase MutT (NUDIX family)
MSTGDIRLAMGRKHQAPPSNFVRLEHLRRLRGSEQVAAICYRLTKRGIKFLLVRTRGGRWTFPKGSVESGLTHAQAAALEAFEEAGVHGRIEEAAFARYVRVKPAYDRHSSEIEVIINAHLCEVARLSAPEEDGRNPTWLSAEKAKRRLRKERAEDYGDDLARIVDRAVARIQRIYREGHTKPTFRDRAEIIDIADARVTASPRTMPLRKPGSRRLLTSGDQSSARSRKK